MAQPGTAAVSSVYQAFADTAAAAAQRPFLHIPAVATQGYADSAIELNYGAALAQIQAHASHYRRQGYGSPLRVALMLQNRAEFFIHWLALNCLGCSVIPLPAEANEAEIRYFIEHGAATLIVSLPQFLPAITGACAALPHAPAIIAADDLAHLPPAPAATDGGPPTAATECALLYTSGSTGTPKGCLLDNAYFIHAGEWYLGLGEMATIRRAEERLLTPLPLHHMNAMAISAMAMMMSAGCIVQLDRFHPGSWWQTVRATDATLIHYLGVLPALLLQQPAGADDDCSRQLRFGFGAGVNPAHHARFEQRFGFPLLEAWAMTESGVGGSIIAHREPRHVGSCCFGVPPATLDYQLVDEQKNVVARGQDGELRVRARGANPARGFFCGYLKDPAATAAIWQDGWLNTGDVVREGADGSLYFVDRRNNIIRRSGENIAAAQVEACLLQDAAISEAIVTAVPDALRGDEVAACIVLTPPQRADAAPDANIDASLDSTPDTATFDTATLEAAAIVRRCLQNLSYFKAPGYVLFCPELPKTASNKPRRGEIKRLAAARVAAGDCVDTRQLKKRRHTS